MVKMNPNQKIRFLGKIRIEKAKGELRRVLVTIPRSIVGMLGDLDEIDGTEVFVTLERKG